MAAPFSTESGDLLILRKDEPRPIFIHPAPAQAIVTGLTARPPCSRTVKFYINFIRRLWHGLFPHQNAHFGIEDYCRPTWEPSKTQFHFSAGNFIDLPTLFIVVVAARAVIWYVPWCLLPLLYHPPKFSFSSRKEVASVDSAAIALVFPSLAIHFMIPHCVFRSRIAIWIHGRLNGGGIVHQVWGDGSCFS